MFSKENVREECEENVQEIREIELSSLEFVIVITN